jgi:hypothetical protein
MNRLFTCYFHKEIFEKNDDQHIWEIDLTYAKSLI